MLLFLAAAVTQLASAYDGSPGTCTDTPNNFMVQNNYNCEDIVSWNHANLCSNGNANWLAQKYCQQVCYDIGLGYDGDDCPCTNTPSPGMIDDGETCATYL